MRIRREGHYPALLQNCCKGCIDSGSYVLFRRPGWLGEADFSKARIVRPLGSIRRNGRRRFWAIFDSGALPSLSCWTQYHLILAHNAILGVLSELLLQEWLKSTVIACLLIQPAQLNQALNQRHIPYFSGAIG